MSNSNSCVLTQKIYFINDLEKIIGRNRLTLRRWWTSGKFPQPVKLNECTLAWRASAIDEWIDENIR